jgi:uncharacterized repeat protein (TIGR01451 family)
MRLTRLGMVALIGASLVATGGPAARAADSDANAGDGSGASPAKPARADLAVSVTGSAVVEKAGKPIFIRLHNNGPAAATGIRLTVDTAGLDTTKLDVQLPNEHNGCYADSFTKVVCVMADIPAGGNDNGITLTSLLVMSIEGTGPAGSYTVSVTADTEDPKQDNNSVTTPVSVAESGIDLIAYAQDVYTRVESTEPVVPGAEGEFFWLLKNGGRTPIQGVTYTIKLPPYLSFVKHEKACRYERKDTVAKCTYPKAVVQPGEYFVRRHGRVPAPTKVKLAANAPGPTAITGGVITGRGLKEGEAAPPEISALDASADDVGVLSAADAAKAVKAATNNLNDVDRTDNTVPFSVFTAKKRADLSITATDARGRVGDTVQLKVTVKNGGPSEAPETRLKVVAPGGTEFVSVDASCKAKTAGREYLCELGTFPVGNTGTGIFKLKILSATVTDGSAEVSSAAEEPEPNDNTAPIKVKVKAAPEPTASPTTKPTTPAKPGGGLPVTGSPVALMGGLGLGAVVLGGGLLLLARRRRAVTDPS